MTELITVSEVVNRLRLDSSSPQPESDDITKMIVSARVAAEQYLNRTLVERQQILELDEFETVIQLPYGDVSSVDEISYIDNDGNSQTVVAHVLSKNRLTAAYDAVWPDTRNQLGAVTITYTAGYTPVGSPAVAPVPENIMLAMFLHIGDMYDHRDVDFEAAQTVQNLLIPHRIDMGV